MLTRLIVRNFKRFDNIDIELGNPVVLIGPNNSGKTTALQALSLWDIGLRRWNEKRSGKQAPEKRPGVTISRRDLIAMPVPDANLLWRDLHVRDVKQVNGKPRTQNVRVEIVVEGVTEGQPWQCGLEFDYANEESLYCRPLRKSNEKNAPRMPVPAQASKQRIAFLPPMSGLAAVEPKWEPGRISVLVGEGQTAQVLRNLCFGIAESAPDQWREVLKHIRFLFGVNLDNPQYIAERGEINMTYREPSRIRLDISASGRGLQQTLLLLAYLYGNPGSVLLLDEPDAHLEILRQRQIYQLLTQVARQQGSQIVAASHSEVVLNEAADRDVVIAFVGSPHRIDDRGSQVLKALAEIGFDQYYQAEQTGWVLYLEGSTDLAILQAFALSIGHPAARYLERPFVHYVANKPQRARDHFFGLREAKKDLAGLAIYDRLDREMQQPPGLWEIMWNRREIENYLCYPEVLLTYATASAQKDQPGPLFAAAEAGKRQAIMQDCINDLVLPVALRNRDDRWWSDVKASDEFLDRLFDAFFKRLGLPNLMRKSDYHVLAELVPEGLIGPEVIEKLDSIVKVAQDARPLEA
ncbi:MAG: AAA family ATPase [Deltaproteobacteria bacterium]|nr:AAA family ATPase [Deltaproteobacteria bacterium]